MDVPYGDVLVLVTCLLAWRTTQPKEPLTKTIVTHLDRTAAHFSLHCMMPPRFANLLPHTIEMEQKTASTTLVTNRLSCKYDTSLLKRDRYH